MKKFIVFFLVFTTLLIGGCSSNQVKQTSQRDKVILLKQINEDESSLHKFNKTIDRLKTQVSENIPGAQEEYEEWAVFYFLATTGNLPALEAYLNVSDK